MTNIVILHGWGQSRESWTYLRENLTDIGDVFAFDLPGFGAEPLVADDWGVPEYAAWVEAKISQMKLDNVILIGHSFGGRISSFLAAQNPAWLQGLVLYGAPCLYRPSWQIRLKILIAKLYKRLGIKRKPRAQSDLAKADNEGMGKIFRKVVNFDQTARLLQISAPTLLIWGANDDAVPLRIAQEMQQLIPRSKLQVLDGVGHNAHLENPYLFHGTVKNFIQNL